MSTITEILDEFADIAEHPAVQLDAHRAAGKQVIGVGPYYAPEELVYAAGAIPFGVWGRMGTVSAARKYFAPFYCSLCQMTLEMGLNHELDKLSGMMVTSLCDTLRGFSQNFRVGVSQVPMIFVSHPQNRKTDAGFAYALASYQEAKEEVGQACGTIVEDDAVSAAIVLYNQWRAEMRTFLALAAAHPDLVSVTARSKTVNAGYYMDKADHLAKLRELNGLLSGQPGQLDGFKRVVLSGIMYDIPALVEMLDELGFAVVADDIAKESRAVQMDIPETGDPVEALARAYCNLDNDSILYDAEKGHVDHVAKLARQSGAQGVILLMAKFCDPEEFDAPHVAKACRAAGVPCVQIEVDQSTETYEQARTQLETFADLLV